MATEASTLLASFAESLRSSVEKSEQEFIPALGPCSTDLGEFYIDIPMSDGFLSRAKVWRPRNGLEKSDDEERKKDHPLILLFHGGGFVAGSCDQLTRPGREFARIFGGVVVSAAYRRAPEHKFPQAMLDGLDTVEWLSQHASSTLHVNLKTGFIVGGYSAGGQLASVIASEARNRNLAFPITGSFLCIPSLFTSALVPEHYRHLWQSREENASPRFNTDVMEKLLQLMEADETSPLFSPVNSPLGLRGLPPTYLQLGGRDILRDDGVVYERLLRDAGVPTKLDSHPGIGHESWTIWTDDAAPTSKALIEDTVEGMRWLLKG